MAYRPRHARTAARRTRRDTPVTAVALCVCACVLSVAAAFLLDARHARLTAGDAPVAARSALATGVSVLADTSRNYQRTVRPDGRTRPSPAVSPPLAKYRPAKALDDQPPPEPAVTPEPAAAEEPAAVTEPEEFPADGTVSGAPHPEEPAFAPSDAVPMPDDMQRVLDEAVHDQNIDYAIGLGLIQVESSFRPDIVNEDSGCYGYCQINPEYWPADLDHAGNIRQGMAILRIYLDKYHDDMYAALTAYHAGHDSGDRYYANSVLAAAQEWADALGLDWFRP